MLDWIRARLAQRTQTSPFPAGAVELPERFRGRPARADGRELPVLDLGACHFSPEEQSAGPGGWRFSGDYRMATRTRDALVTASGEV